MALTRRGFLEAVAGMAIGASAAKRSSGTAIVSKPTLMMHGDANRFSQMTWDGTTLHIVSSDSADGPFTRLDGRRYLRVEGRMGR